MQFGPPQAKSPQLNLAQISLSRRKAKFLLLAAATIALVGVLAPNGLLTAFAVAVLFALVLLLNRPGEPPALLFAAGYQWMQATALLFTADFQGQIWEPSGLEAAIWDATCLTLVGVLALGVGAFVGRGRSDASAIRSVFEDAAAFSLRAMFAAWVVTLILTPILSLVASRAGPLSQVFRTMALGKWAIIFMLATIIIARGSGYRTLAFVVCIEIMSGLLGFFSEFKTVFIVVGLAMLYTRNKLSVKALIVLSIMTVFVLLLGMFWSTIKQEYRDFLNRGSGQQVVDVSLGSSLGMIVELAQAQTLESLVDGGQQLLERIGYVYFFSLALDYVPAIAPYENGALWLGAVKHILVPRVIDPAKAVLDDSEQTYQYTGSRVAGSDEGTSIGLGYIAESYVDFGPIFMFVPIFAFGVLVGRMYRTLAARRQTPLLGIAFATVMVVFNTSLVETSIAKMLGGAVTAFLVFYVIVRVGGEGINNFMREMVKRRG